MPAKADVVQVTDVQLKPTATGLEIILKTASGASPQVFTTSYNQTLLIDVSNAQLKLPEGQEFYSDNPIEGITSVTVTPLYTNSIRVTVMGTQALPNAEVTPSAQGLVLGIAAPSSTAEAIPTPETSVPETPVPETPQGKPEGETEPSAPSTAGAEPEAPTEAPMAEEEAEPEAATEAPTAEEEIEIVVTGEGEQEGGYQVPTATSATRTDTPLRDIPQSIQAIPQQVLEDQQVVRLDDALRNVSGVVQDNNAAGRSENFIIRGFGAPDVLRDGFRQFGDRGFPETANLERIEVLKGPASVLYGAGEPGGVINLVTKKPLSDPFYSAELQVGSYGFWRPTLDFSGPLNSDKTVLYRLNAAYERSDGFRDYEQDTERFFISPVLSWKIGDRTDLTLELEYLNDERPSDRGLVAFGDGVADIPITRILGEPDDFSKFEEFSTGYQIEHRFNDNWKVRNGFRYARRDLELFATDSRGSVNETTGLLPRRYGVLDQLNEAYSLQTNVIGEFATGSVEHTLLFGVDLIRDSQEQIARFGQRAPLAPLPINIFDPVYESSPKPDPESVPIALNTDLVTDRLGVYVQDQIALTDNLKLLLGGRFDIVDQELQNNPTASDSEGSLQNQKDEAFTPRVGIVYQPIEEISLYANFARSFRPNTGTTVSGEFLEPEQGTQYEAGVKAELFDGRVSTTLAFYQITKANLATTDPNNADFAIAVGEQRSQGIELDVIGEILPGWNIIASYSYIDAEITQDNVFEVGNRLVNVPKHSASLWTTYEVQSGGLRGLGFGAGLFYVGERAGDLDNTYEVPSYIRTDAAVYYRRDRWKVGLNFRNLFDIDYFQNSANSRRGVAPGEPFTVLGTVSVEF